MNKVVPGSKKHPRITREEKTVAAMIELFCRQRHCRRHDLCEECQELLDYARERLDKCPFQEGKTVCSFCTVHCYKPEMREKIRVVMRFAGPRMLYRHPLMTIQHIMDRRRKSAAV